MNILEQFIREYNELHYNSFHKESISSVFSEIRQVEKIMTNPKFYPNDEMKSFYKNLRERYNAPFKIMLIGKHALAKIIFINVLLKDSVIPLHNMLAQKKIIIKFSPYNFSRIHYKTNAIDTNLHAFDCTQANLEEVEYFEIFTNAEILRNIEIIKDSDEINKKTISTTKEADMLLWILELKSKINYHDILIKIMKKKPIIAILTHTSKIFNSNELLEQISAETNNLNTQFGIQQIYDIDLWNLFYEYKLDEKFMFHKTFIALAKQTTQTKTKTNENVFTYMENAKHNIESFYAQKHKSQFHPITAADNTMQHDTLQNLTESIHKNLQNLEIIRGSMLLKEALEKNKIIDSHYKSLFEHYRILDDSYHKANLILIAKTIKLHDEYRYEVLHTISKSLKKYLDSIVDSILDNVESIRIRTRPSMPSFFDILTNRRIVYQSFQINNETVLKELEDSQSLLARKYKSLLTKINRFDMYVNQNVVDNLESFSFVIEEWIRKGHHLVLQKKPSFISIEPYLSLEEFNLSVHTHFTKKHHTIIRDFVDTMQSNLLALSIWVQATKKVLFECVISHLEKKFQHDKNLAKNCKAKEIKPLDRDFLINTILNILPEEIQRLFCELPSTKGTLDNIPALLHAETKENEKIIRYRIREIIDLRQNVKVATKILENAIAAYAKT